MSYVPADVLYEQLDFLKRSGHDLEDYIVDGCDSFAGEAIILPKEDTEE
jgi:hypothetical protein